MRFGLAELLGNLRMVRGSNFVGFAPPAIIPTSFTYTLPNALPESTQALTIDSSGNWSYASVGAGTVASVGLSAPSIFSVSGSPVTTSGTLALGFAAGQTANLFLASPNGSAGAVGLRAIAWGDVSSLAGTTGSTFAAGNDARFHTQGTDSGTTQTSFQIDSGGSGPRLSNSSGAIRLRNAANTADADLICHNLTVTGTTTTINSETLTIDDNIIVLNNNVSTGTPTEDGGIQVRRGSSTAASLTWDETNDLWKAGLAGSEIPLTRTFRTTFTNSSLTGGVLTATHNLGNKLVTVQISDNNDKIVLPDEVTLTSATQASIDLTSFGTLTGTWSLVICG